MIDERIRSKLYDETDRKYPVRRGIEEKRAGDDETLLNKEADLSIKWQQATFELKEQLLAQLLFHLHTLFELPMDDSEVKRLTREALAEIYGLEEKCRANGSFDAPSYASFLFRRNWHALLEPVEERPDGQEAATAAFAVDGSATMLTGLQHVEKAIFLQKHSQEIAGWAKWFLQIERYHRLDAVEHEARLDRYRLLRSQPGKKQETGWSFDDLIIWLEFRMLEQFAAHREDIGALSRDISTELSSELLSELLATPAIQPSLYVLLRCHQYCLAETLSPSEQRRLEELYANRRLDSLLDLMRIVVNTSIGEHVIPDSGTLLDRLQSAGFNIEHQGFRDPYEAQLVALEDVERLENAELALFLPLATLTGDFSQDSAWSRQTLKEWHDRTLKEIITCCHFYAAASAQPLPKAHLLAQLVRFATAWTLAGYPWLPAGKPENLVEEARKMLPDSALRQLIRPRKGYELKSRNDLTAMIELECQHQWEALERIARNRLIRGHYDYSQFLRYVTFQLMRERSEGDPLAACKQAARIAGIVELEWVSVLCTKWGLDSKQVQPNSVESVEKQIRSLAPAQPVVAQLARHFESPDADLQEVYDSVVHTLAPTFYRILVAHGRKKAELARPQAAPEHIPEIVSLLAPPLEFIQRRAFLALKSDFAQTGVPVYRQHLLPYLTSASEWKAYLAWQAHTQIGADVERFLADGDLDGLLAELEKAAERVQLPPDTLAFETVKSALIEFIKSGESGAPAPEKHVQDILQLLPQLDCAACGQASCREFAHALLGGRMEPQHCLQLPKHQAPQLTKSVKRYREADTNGGRPASLMKLLSDHHEWRASSEKKVFQEVLSVKAQKARRLLLDRLEEVWSHLSPKPQIFKYPDLETVHQELCRYMGHEAVERLRDEEKAYLAEHGEERLKIEWRLLKESQNWLSRANRKRRSRPLLQRQDAAWVAADAYQDLFFLRQLSRFDRDLILRYRLEQYQDGFSHWWNEDLLTMNLPGFFIRDWEDFSKIITNAYWHQESSPCAAFVLSVLKSEPFFADSSERLRSALVEHWLDSESQLVEQRRKTLAQVRQMPEQNPIENVEHLRSLIQALIDESECGGQFVVESSTLPVNVSADDRLLLQNDDIWRRFQAERARFDAGFSCHSGELTEHEKKSLESRFGGNGKGAARHKGSADIAWYLTGWDEPLQKRIGLIRAMIAAECEKRHAEDVECRWLERILGSEQAAPEGVLDIPSSSLRLLIRREIRSGKEKSQILSALQEHLLSRGDLQDRLIEDSLFRLILNRQYHAVRRAGQSSHLQQSARSRAHDLPVDPSRVLADSSNEWRASPEESALLQALPELRSFIDLLLERHKTLDRERLLHYLFLLAKMEGNLDSLTALLREIRETSDIMEAAWLRFTEERIQEGPGPKSLPGTALGIPLLVSRLKEKEAVSLGLTEGVSRKEKRSIAAAVNELISFMRFHILLGMEHNGSLQSVTRDFFNAGYDLTGLDDPSVEAAMKRQWERREQFLDQKIWIYTTVTARRLAAQDHELQEAERDFYRVRSEILKKEASANDPHHEIASRRGVALGKIKEEMYRQLSDLLETERIATFQKRINQIVDQLDRKRQEIHFGWLTGAINRRTIFYLLREHQKQEREPNWADFQRFLRDHWLLPLAELRESTRPDRDERIRDLDNRFKALLGCSLLEWEAEAQRAAEQDLHDWLTTEIQNLESQLG